MKDLKIVFESTGNMSVKTIRTSVSFRPRGFYVFCLVLMMTRS